MLTLEPNPLTYMYMGTENSVERLVIVQEQEKRSFTVYQSKNISLSFQKREREKKKALLKMSIAAGFIVIGCPQDVQVLL